MPSLWSSGGSVPDHLGKVAVCPSGKVIGVKLLMADWRNLRRNRYSQLKSPILNLRGATRARTSSH